MRAINILYFVFVISDFVRGQGRLPNGDIYLCVPPGICSEMGIDPRIMTPGATPPPGQPSCPAGMEPCFPQGPNSNCGLRYVRVTQQADGEAQVGAYPWQAYLQGPGSPSGFIGSGSLISPYHVLTATHKVLAFRANPSQITVILGVNDPATMNAAPAAPRSRAAQIFIYETAAVPYNNDTLKNDIAIIRLATPISLVDRPTVNTICLPFGANATTFQRKQTCVVSGWGQIQPTNVAVPTKLKQVAVNTTDIATCAKGFQGKVNVDRYLDTTGGQLCAGGEPQRDACFQDGGAPLNCGGTGSAPRYTVAGIVIWGKSCGQPGVYGVYTNVPFYMNWIISVLTAK